jgi:hypothetical protein
MDDTRKMLQAIINGQNALKQDLVKRIDQVVTEVKGVKEDLRLVEKKLTVRIDRVGKSLAYLEEDAPIREEFDELEDRVVKLEQKPTN